MTEKKVSGVWPLLAKSTEKVTFKSHATRGGFQILRPGMVLSRKCVPLYGQVEIVREYRRLGLGEGGLYQPAAARISGGKLRLQMMCLGRD